MEYDLEKISNNIQKKKKLSKTLQIIVFSILIILFLISTFLINYDQDKDEPNNFFGIYVFDITSKSMIPTLNENDIIIVKKVNMDDLKEEDIISFRNGEKIISHRIVRIEENNNQKIFITKGDNNKSEDDFETDYDSIYGKQLFKIPYIGKQIRFLHEKNGLLIIIIFIGILFILHRIKESKKNHRKKIRWKYETKKKREKYLDNEKYEKEI